MYTAPVWSPYKIIYKKNSKEFIKNTPEWCSSGRDSFHTDYNTRLSTTSIKSRGKKDFYRYVLLVLNCIIIILIELYYLNINYIILNTFIENPTYGTSHARTNYGLHDNTIDDKCCMLHISIILTSEISV